jgi:cadmium resistance protein CadD (predicted permease)
MQEAVIIAGLAVATFVSTSVDNLLLLVGFLGSPGFRVRSMVVGYVGAVVLALAAGLAVSYAADFAPNRYASYLGLVPIGMGVARLYGALRHRGGTDGVAAVPVTRGALSVGVVMVANSSDSLAAFVPLFAETREPFTFLIVAVGVGLSLVWCWLARWIASHAAVQKPLQKWGAYVLPIMLILVGAYILTDTGTDTI